MDPTKKTKKHDAPTHKKKHLNTLTPQYSKAKQPTIFQIKNPSPSLNRRSKVPNFLPPSAKADRVNGLLDQIRSSLLELELGTFDWDGMAVGGFWWMGNGVGRGWLDDRLRGGGLLKVLVGDSFFWCVFYSVHEVVDTRRIFVFYFMWNIWKWYPCKSHSGVVFLNNFQNVGCPRVGGFVGMLAVAGRFSAAVYNRGISGALNVTEKMEVELWDLVLTDPKKKKSSCSQQSMCFKRKIISMCFKRKIINLSTKSIFLEEIVKFDVCFEFWMKTMGFMELPVIAFTKLWSSPAALQNLSADLQANKVNALWAEKAGRCLKERFTPED